SLLASRTSEFYTLSLHDALPISKLLDKEPALVNSFMDWGGGDWESGLGAASHMGNRDMAMLLLERGARMDVFCAVMMGQLDAVRDRKSTRLNSSHLVISYAVFCL